MSRNSLRCSSSFAVATIPSTISTQSRQVPASSSTGQSPPNITRYGWLFDICVSHHQLLAATELVRSCPEVNKDFSRFQGPSLGPTYSLYLGPCRLDRRISQKLPSTSFLLFAVAPDCSHNTVPSPPYATAHIRSHQPRWLALKARQRPRGRVPLITMFGPSRPAPVDTLSGYGWQLARHSLLLAGIFRNHIQAGQRHTAQIEAMSSQDGPMQNFKFEHVVSHHDQIKRRIPLGPDGWREFV